jgi:hypothetical protein
MITADLQVSAWRMLRVTDPYFLGSVPDFS